MTSAPRLACIDPQWLAPQPSATATALPAPLYTDEVTLALERDAVFARSWQLVAHAGQLSATGDHALAEVAGVPLLLVRGEDGELRALHNVCRHRAGPLATCDGRGARALRCKYHGWTYGLDGQLRSAPEMAEATNFDASTIRLPKAEVAIWQGLVFAALNPATTLNNVLDGIDARLGAHAPESYVFDHRDSYEIACNWKVYIDNFLEGYHVPHIHPVLNRMLDYRSYTTQLAEWHSLQHSPLENTGGIYASGEALYYFVWPNIMLNILPGRMQTNRVTPLGADRCRVDFDYFYAPADDADDDAQRERDRKFSDEVQLEDVDICVAVQRGLRSGSYFAGRLNPRRESGVLHFHELWRHAVRAHMEQM